MIKNNDTAQHKPNPYTTHLIELRKRLIYSFTSILVIFILLIPFAQYNYNTLSQPLVSILPQHGHLIATNLTANFVVPLQLNFCVALFITAPFLLYQFWRFIAPGLYHYEKKRVFAIILTSIILFYSSIILTFFMILPMALHFFIHISPESVIPMTDMNQYLIFCLNLCFIIATVFQIPVLIFVLLLVGIFKVDQLVQYRKYIIVMFFFIAMFISPPDALSMLFLATAMCLLFEFGLMLSKYILKNK
ncbi:twin-arginine translocase subunit TatC [Acinetobacter larvae]|uniref:Sec-independent protein translocase protein TatC n=1 Tax=Acinetobacter larvae TaxID=1789224 RepID=A0A1B2LZJ6_9GAMM|nr:twin-arginine translocase subunit TatC [Acinetobacter larvae]AOA58378.1 twin arginine-targeting protein translocase TatC [Acinetobacter larvae]